MSSNRCFVCLEKTSNRVCKSCKCYAHPSCWAKYVKTKNNLEFYSSLDTADVMIVEVENLTCPQCRKSMNVNNTVTRSKTFSAKCLYILKKIIDFIDEMEYIRNIEHFRRKNSPDTPLSCKHGGRS